MPLSEPLTPLPEPLTPLPEVPEDDPLPLRDPEMPEFELPLVCEPLMPEFVPLEFDPLKSPDPDPETPELAPGVVCDPEMPEPVEPLLLLLPLPLCIEPLVPDVPVEFDWVPYVGLLELESGETPELPVVLLPNWPAEIWLKDRPGMPITRKAVKMAIKAAV